MRGRRGRRYGRSSAQIGRGGVEKVEVAEGVKRGVKRNLIEEERGG